MMEQGVTIDIDKHADSVKIQEKDSITLSKYSRYKMNLPQTWSCM